MKKIINYILLCGFSMSLIASKNFENIVFEEWQVMDAIYKKTEKFSPYDLWQKETKGNFRALVNDRDQVLCRYHKSLGTLFHDAILKAREANTYMIVNRCPSKGIVIRQKDVKKVVVNTKEKIKDQWLSISSDNVKLRFDSFYTKSWYIKIKNGKKSEFKIHHDRAYFMYQPMIKTAQEEHKNIEINMTALRSYSHQKYLHMDKLIRIAR